MNNGKCSICEPGTGDTNSIILCMYDYMRFIYIEKPFRNRQYWWNCLLVIYAGDKVGLLVASWFIDNS